MNRDVVSPPLSFAAPGGLPVTPCIPSDPRESDCNLIPQAEYGRFGMRLFRFRLISSFRDGPKDQTRNLEIFSQRRFRVRVFDAPRNDDYSESGAVAASSHILVASSTCGRASWS